MLKPVKLAISKYSLHDIFYLVDTVMNKNLKDTQFFWLELSSLFTKTPNNDTVS